MDVVGVRITVTAKAPGLRLPRQDYRKPVSARSAPTRRVHLPDGWRPATVPVYKSESIPPGARVSGPALIDQPNTTVLVLPGFAAWRDDLGSILLERAQ
jgi:N-methylhydantoinase A